MSAPHILLVEDELHIARGVVFNLEQEGYLVTHVATCLVCHTPHDLGVVGQPLERDRLGAGGVPFGREEAVPGLVISTNLTPEGLGGWSDGEILHALTTGVNPSHKVAYPLMPWTRYRGYRLRSKFITWLSCMKDGFAQKISM